MPMLKPKETSPVRFLWLGIIILCGAQRLLALDAPGPPTLDDSLSMEWASYDHPKEFQTWLRKTYRALDRKQNPKHWVRAFAYLAEHAITSAEPWEEAEDYRQLGAEALQLAWDEKWIEDYVHIYYIFKNPNNSEQQPDAATQTLFFQDYLVLIEKLKGPAFLRLFAETQFAYHLEGLGQIQDAFRIMKDAYERIKDDPQVSGLHKLVLSMHLAYFFNKTGDLDRGQTISDMAYQILSRTRLRLLTINIMTNTGNQHYQLHTSEGYQLADKYYLKALEAAQDLDDAIQISRIYVSMSRLAWKQKRSSAGITYADQALDYLQNLNDPLWASEALLQKSRNQLDIGFYSEALANIEQANRNFDPNNLFDQRNVEQVRADAYKGLKRYDEAFSALQRSFELDGLMIKEKSQAELTSQLASLGLQVEKARSDTLSYENQQKDQELFYAKRLRIILVALLILAAAVMGLMISSLHKKRLLAISQKKIKAIMDHIDEGIVLIKPDLTIETEYSRFLETLLDIPSHSMAGRHAIEDVVHHFVESKEDATLVTNALNACFHEDQTAWDFNEGHLLHEAKKSVHGRLTYFAFSWQPIFNQEQRLVRVLFGVRDVTNRKMMEAEVAAERREKFALFEKVQELLSIDRSQVVSLLDRLENLTQVSAASISPIRFELHSLKGLSRTLGLKTLSEAIHQKESDLVPDRFQEGQIIDWQGLTVVISSYRHLLQEVLGAAKQNQSTRGGLASIVAKLLPDLRQRSEDNGLRWGGIELMDRCSVWDPILFEVVSDLLLHATTNSIDHGYKNPQLRGAQVSAVQLRVQLVEENGELVLSMRDHGAGIHWPGLEIKAQRLNFSWKNRDELLALLFQEGVSTAEELSMTSGRGVGLSAMKHRMDTLGGRIEIRPFVDAGTELICVWPVANRTMLATA